MKPGFRIAIAGLLVTSGFGAAALLWAQKGEADCLESGRENARAVIRTLDVAGASADAVEATLRARPELSEEETIAVARSSFVEDKTATRLGPDLAQLGKLPAADAPGLGGYNLTYLKPLASVGLRTSDGHQAPVLTMWPRGAGRVSALTAEVDGPHTGDFRAWAGQRALLTQLVRWTMPPLALQLDAVARAQLIGNDLHVTLDFDPNAPPPAGTPTLVLLAGDAKTRPLELPMRWEDEDRVGAHFVLPGSGTWHPVVRLGDRLFRAPPVTLPWAPEFEPAPASEGKALLSMVAKAGGGVERLAMVGLFKDAVESEAAVPLTPSILALCVALLVAEVFVRRFLSGPRLRRRARPSPAVVAAAMPRAVTSPGVPVVASPADEPPPPKPSAPTLQDALSAAREKARKRTGR